MASCTVCRHPEASAINDALLAGGARLTVARRFGLTESSVRRHWRKHLPAELRLESQEEQRAERRRLRREADYWIGECQAQITRAQRRGWRKAQWRAVRLWAKLASLRARILELERVPTPDHAEG